MNLIYILNIVDCRFSKEELRLDIFEKSKRVERSGIGELRLRLNESEYMMYEIELYVDFKSQELKRVLSRECTCGCDRDRMRMLKDLSG